MKRPALLILLSASTANAQLQVTTPPAPACAPDATPILGIGLDPVFDGDYGFEMAGEIEKALQRAGFKVYADYEWNILDKASILITGDVDHWKNFQGDRSNRVGHAYVVVKDIGTDDLLLNMEQKPATLVFNAPTKTAFINDVVSNISKRFCQKRSI